MQQIVFLDSDTLDAGINLRRPDFPHHWQSYPETRPEQVVERLSCASIAIINNITSPMAVIKNETSGSAISLPSGDGRDPILSITVTVYTLGVTGVITKDHATTTLTRTGRTPMRIGARVRYIIITITIMKVAYTYTTTCELASRGPLIHLIMIVITAARVDTITMIAGGTPLLQAPPTVKTTRAGGTIGAAGVVIRLRSH